MLGRRERKREQTKQGLLSAAIQLFVEKGYEQTTIDDIAAQADVAKVTFYYYFKSKEEIVLEIKKTSSDEVLGRAEKLLDQNVAASEILKTLVADVMRWTQDNWRLLEVFIRQRFSPLMKGEACHEDEVPPMILLLERVIAHGQKSGEFRANVDAKETAHFVALAIFNEQFVWIQQGRQTVGMMASMNRCLDFILHGVSASPPGEFEKGNPAAI